MHAATENRANRARVLDFEKETADRLETLHAVEEEILSVGKLRSRWLLSVSNIDEVESETFRLKMEHIKARADLASLTLQVDKVKLEGHYESQTLNFLINATKPLEPGETKEARAKALEHLAKENLEDLNHALRSCCDLRAKLAREMHASTLELSKLRNNNDNRHASVVGELQEKITAYAERMKEAVITSKRQHQKITGEYLVLRHNTRVAKEVLLRSQNEAALARKLLQEKLDRLVEEAAVQREKMEAGAIAELKVMTDDIRNSVIKKESEVGDLRRSIAQLEASRAFASKKMRKSIKTYNEKYEALSKKREGEVKQLQSELANLRGMIHRVEMELASDEKASHMTAHDEDYTIFRQIESIQRNLERTNIGRTARV